MQIAAAESLTIWINLTTDSSSYPGPLAHFVLLLLSVPGIFSGAIFVLT
ncbi:hypothetical protein HGG71_09005 [Rhodobacteraceae bacterium R_SAG2]|nr:hypothetical protein [Rhodobacteraceae bacterium R_SAG2]